MIRIFSYSRETKRMETPGLAELPRHISDRGRMIWVDIEDPTDEETGVLGGIFGFHALAVEDCMRSGLLPKLNVYDGYVFLVIHAVDFGRAKEAFETLEVDVFIGGNYLVTYHRNPVKGIFDARGQVAKNPGSLLRSPEWLLHGILDGMFENYEPALQGLEDRVAAAERTVLEGREDGPPARSLKLRDEVFHLGRVAGLQSEILQQMADGGMSWIADENRVYYRNVYDGMVRNVQAAALYTARISGARDAFFSAVSLRTCRAIRRLNVLAAALLLPLLVAGIFGMNFQVRPEGAWSNGYSVVLGVMAFLMLGTVLVFKKKRWF